MVPLTLLQLLFVSCMIASTTEDDTTTRRPLNVLVLLPYPDASRDSGWDRGLELLPAARVAVREINNDSSLLPGYRMELIEKPSDACGVPQSTIGFHNFVYNTFERESPIAIMGLACSTVTSTISPIAGRGQVGLLQVSMANSHVLQDQEMFPHLWRVISAVSVNVNATISLMNRFNWTRVAQLYDGNGIFFQSSANFFRQRIINNDKYNLVFDHAIEEDPSFIESAMAQIESNTARIIFVSSTVPEAKLLMCEAAKRNLVWPGYVWIFNSRAVSDLVYSECTLPQDELLRAIENVTLVDLSLDGRKEDDMLVSGLTYGQYRAAYLQELENIRTEFQSNLVNYELDYNNPFANPMYDEVWALALALNASLPELQSNSSDISSISRPKLTEIVESRLHKLNFEGAVSRIKFNSLKEAVTPVTFFHVRNGRGVDVGRYDDSTNTLQLYNISKESFPDDDILVEYELIPFAVSLVYIILAVILAVFTTILVIFMFVLYDSPEVRATSPLLSSLMFIGCYLFIISVFMVMVRQSFLINETAFMALCAMQRLVLETAYSLIAFTLLFRLIRIYRLFHNSFAKPCRYWKDGWLVCYIVIFSLTPSIFFVFFFVVINSFKYVTIDKKVTDNPPTVVKTPACGLENPTAGYYVDAFIAIYLIVPIMLVMIFAFGTRKVSYSNFKDTKKIIIYGYFFCGFTFVIYFLWSIFRFSELPIVTALVLGTAALIEAFAVQMFFFVPKILPSIIRKISGNKSHTLTARTSLKLIHISS